MSDGAQDLLQELEGRFSDRAIRLRAAVEKIPAEPPEPAKIRWRGRELRLGALPLDLFLRLFDRGSRASGVIEQVPPAQRGILAELLGRLDEEGFLEPPLPPLPPGSPAEFLQSLERLPLEDPPLQAWLARAQPPGAADPVFGLAVHLDEKAAQGAAVGEAFERHAATVYNPEEVLSTSFAELAEAGRRAVPPARLSPFSAAQLEAFSASREPWMPQPFRDDTVTGWVEGEDLASGEAVLVPAAWVYLPYLYREGEDFLTDCASTGLAVGPSLPRATLSALLETIERDSVACAWLSGAPWRRAPLEAFPRLHRLWREKLQPPGVRLHLADLTQDLGIPTLVAIFEATTGGLVLGTASRLKAEDAALKAVLEAHQARFSWREVLEKGGPPFPREEVSSFADHALLYTDPKEAARVFERLKEPAETGPPEDFSGGGTEADADRLRSLVAHLASRGLSPLRVEITPREPPSEWHAVRVIVPGLVPINGRPALRPLGLERIYTAPVAAGWLERSPAEAELTAAPHPFP